MQGEMAGSGGLTKPHSSIYQTVPAILVHCCNPTCVAGSTAATLNNILHTRSPGCRALQWTCFSHPHLPAPCPAQEGLGQQLISTVTHQTCQLCQF